MDRRESLYVYNLQANRTGQECDETTECARTNKELRALCALGLMDSAEKCMYILIYNEGYLSYIRSRLECDRYYDRHILLSSTSFVVMMSHRALDMARMLKWRSIIMNKRQEECALDR